MAINYAKNNWKELTQFLNDSRLPLDNNAAERALRIAALGRKNYLFVGHDTAGENLAAREIDDLLPHRWQPKPA